MKSKILFFVAVIVSLLVSSLAHVWGQEGKVAEKPIVVAFVGDSLTEGYGVSKTAAYPHVVGELLKQKNKNVKTINSGISGATSASGPKQVKWVLRAKPQWVVVALGANDGLRGLKPEEMKKNLVTTLDLIQQAGAKAVLVGMKTPPNFGAEYGKNFEVVYQQIAKEKKNIVYIPFLLDRVGGERNLNLEDGIHPNEKGHRVMAEMLVQKLEPLL